MMKFLRYLPILLLVLANVGCDQVSKSLVRENVEYYEQIELVAEHVKLTKVENTGAFFGLGQDLSPLTKKLVLNLLPALAILAMLGFLFLQKNMSKTMAVGMAFTVGGGIGNVIDRVAYGSVTDFLHIDFMLFETGIFNLADVSIMVGLGLVLWGYRPQQETDQPAPLA